MGAGSRRAKGKGEFTRGKPKGGGDRPTPTSRAKMDNEGKLNPKAPVTENQRRAIEDLTLGRNDEGRIYKRKK